MNDAAASILCVGMGWFPTRSGGLNRYVYELTHQLAANHDRIELCAAGLPLTASTPPIHLTNLADPNKNLPQRLWQTHQQFCQRQSAPPDAINLHFSLYSFPILSKLPQNVPVTFTFHGPWALESKQERESIGSIYFKRWLEQQVYRRCDRFIVLSNAFGTILHETYAIPWQRIHVIPGGVNTTRFQPTVSRQTARQRLGWANDRTILFTPRRLVHRMGIDQLLIALVQVKQQIPSVWLAIAGKGHLREALEQQARELGLSDHVQFLGFLPDDQLPLAYQAADLTVVPSQSLEGFGLILLESLACGTPAVCTPVGGMPEVLSPFSSDLITQATDAAAISQQLIALLTGQRSLPSRNACRNYVCQNFDWQTISQQIRSVLLVSK